MATRRRTAQQNRQYYLNRKAKAQAEGLPGYGAKRRIQKQADPDSNNYYRKLVTGNGDIAATWRDVANRTDGLEVDNAELAIAFAKAERSARYQKTRSGRAKVRAEFVASLGLTAAESQWLLFQLNGTP